MQKDGLAIKNIIGSGKTIDKLYPVKHPGKGSIKVFKIKGEDKKYLLKSYPEQKLIEKETKNLDNINPVKAFNKPQYIGKHENFFIQEFIEGKLLQQLIDKFPEEKLHEYYASAVENLSKIHSSRNYLKDKRKLNREFEKNSLRNRLDFILKMIEDTGLESYAKATGKSTLKWNKALRKINISSLVNDLCVEGDNYFLGHGDYKPDNIIFTKDKEVFVIDWISMSKAQPWYDLAYLLVHLNKKDKLTYLEHYLQKMKENKNLLNLSMKKARKLFSSGIIFQQMIRAKSNSHQMNSYKDKHHINEFERAMNGLVQETENRN